MGSLKTTVVCTSALGPTSLGVLTIFGNASKFLVIPSVVVLCLLLVTSSVDFSIGALRGV